MKRFNLELTESEIQQMLAVINFSIKSAGLQHEDISRLSLVTVDLIRQKAVEIPETPKES